MTLEDAQEILIGEGDYTEDQVEKAEIVQYRAFETLKNMKSTIKLYYGKHRTAEEVVDELVKDIAFVELCGNKENVNKTMNETRAEFQEILRQLKGDE